MKRALVVLAAALAAALVARAEAPAPSVTLKVDHPKVNVVKMGGGNALKSRRPVVETKNTTSDYTGKISCTPPKGTTATVLVEAYFVTRKIGKGAKDDLSKKEEIDRFTFGEGNPSVQTFSFTSPMVAETETSERKRGRGRRAAVNVEKTKAGVRYMGVIVRALSEDRKVLKVVTEPANPAWLKAGKAAVVEL